MADRFWCIAGGVITLLTAVVITEDLYHKKIINKTSFDKIRTYAEEVARCHIFQKYYAGEMNSDMAIYYVGLNSKHPAMKPIDHFQYIKKEYKNKNLEERKIIAIKNWFIAYFKHYKKFDISIYKKHMGDYNVDFESVKSKMSEKEWAEIREVAHKNNVDIRGIENSCYINLETISEISTENRDLTKYRERLIQKPSVTHVSQRYLNF